MVVKAKYPKPPSKANTMIVVNQNFKVSIKTKNYFFPFLLFFASVTFLIAKRFAVFFERLDLPRGLNVVPLFAIYFPF
jgi:hypothetical protein